MPDIDLPDLDWSQVSRAFIAVREYQATLPTGEEVRVIVRDRPDGLNVWAAIAEQRSDGITMSLVGSYDDGPTDEDAQREALVALRHRRGDGRPDAQEGV
jgi:hypothetical protein